MKVPVFVWALGWAWAIAGLSCLTGCDAAPVDENPRVGALAIPDADECAGACSEWHCGLVQGWRAEAEAAGDACAVACRDAEIECLHAPPEACGWCGLASNECVDACAPESCNPALSEAVQDEIDARSCELDCYVTELECLAADHEYAGLCGQCELDAAVCRSGCQ
jgi:hypothetical protein